MARRLESLADAREEGRKAGWLVGCLLRRMPQKSHSAPLEKHEREGERERGACAHSLKRKAAFGTKHLASWQNNHDCVRLTSKTEDVTLKLAMD